MANLSKAANTEVQEPTKVEEWVVDRLTEGKTVAEIARLLAKGDKAKVGRYRRWLWRKVRKDAQFQRNIAERARGHLVMAIPAAAAGQSRRAARGRTDAAKLVFESTGFHNPRVKHEHSGDIKITIDMPRPSFGSDEDTDDD